jgi:ubiquinone/menaquinone biosynthesis C-methylase UbiE
MLAVARQILPATTTFVTADNRDLPLPDACVDLVTAGWSFGHATEWIRARGKPMCAPAIGEMLRVLRPGGVAIIFKTLRVRCRSACATYGGTRRLLRIV